LTRKPPKHLSKESQTVCLDLQKEWEFTKADFFLFVRGLEAYDRLLQAQDVIKRSGLFLKNKVGKVYVNPATNVEKESMLIILRTWRQLGLKVPPPVPRIGRPPNAKPYFDDDEGGV